MNHSTAIFLISDACRGIGCVFEDTKHAKQYTFKTLDPDIAIGDMVLVPSDNDNFRLKVVKVAALDVEPDFDSRIEYKWIVGKVDSADHDTIKAQEEAAIEKVKSAQKRKRREELRDALIADSGGNASALLTVGSPTTPDTAD